VKHPLEQWLLGNKRDAGDVFGIMDEWLSPLLVTHAAKKVITRRISGFNGWQICSTPTGDLCLSASTVTAQNMS